MPKIANKSNISTDKKLIENYDGLKIKAVTSNQSWELFNNQIKNIEKYLSDDTKVIIIKLFMQLGSRLPQDKVFDYLDKENITVNIQPKIKNYIEFKSIESADRYLKEEMGSNDLYLRFEVDNKNINM